MSIKKTMLAAALAAFAFAALPAFASAQPELEIEKSGHFEISGNETRLTTAENLVTCTSVGGTGEFEGNPSTTGTVEFIFKGCKSKGTSCGTVTAASGEITPGKLNFHLVTATDVTGEEPAVDAVLITPKNPNVETTKGLFATFKCAFGLVPVTVEGTGIIGRIEAPNTNEASKTFAITFEEHEEGVTQTYEHIEGSEHAYDLEAKVGSSGAFETAAQVGTGIGTFTEESLNTLIKG